ncbi:MAG: phasin family protein [Telluria sp.]
MSTLPEQFSAASKAQIEAQLEFFHSMGARAFEGAARLVALNMDTGRAAVDSSSAAIRQLAEVRDARDLLALAKAAPQDFDKVMHYGREWFSIVSEVQAAMFKPAAPVALHAVPASAPAAAPADDARAVKPGKKPVVAMQPEPAPAPLAAEKPIASAAGIVAGSQPVATPSAASLVESSADQILPLLKPVDATPPPAVFHQDLLAPKRGKKR